MKFSRASHNKITNKLAITIPMLYFVVIIFTVTASYIILNKISIDSAQKKVNEASVKTITSIKTNCDLMIENIDNYSKIMLSDNNLQNLLRQGSVYSNLQTQAKVSYSFYNLIQLDPVIDSVYIFDNSDNFFSVSQRQYPTFAKQHVKDAPWYNEAIKKKGRYILRLNGGGAFSNGSNGNFVSFIRLIRDLNNVNTLGIMVINVSESAFLQSYSNVADENSLQILILDENNQTIVPNITENKSVNYFKQLLSENRDFIQQKLSAGGSDYITFTLQSQRYLVSYLSDGSSGWKYISILPYNMVQTENSSVMFLMFILLVVNGVIFFISSFLISRNTITPIQQLLRSMKGVNQGKFNEVEIKPKSYEFEQLFNGYNTMIRQINQLLQKIIQEQKTIRKAELNTLQAQIKPHFLYNTLDSISSLALSGQSGQVCDLVESLGNYYRVSVSKGKEVITVREEIDMVRNYLNIQKVRYQDLFEAIFDIEESCLEYPVLKLVLQPLVENSLYHGIREKGTSGTIIITARELKDAICLSVADDGIGMSKQEIETILKQEKGSQSKSFGLWGTMERIRIFYREENSFQIESEPGTGTKITLTIPKGEC